MADWYEGSTRPDPIAEFPAKDGATFSLTNRGGKVDRYKWSLVDEIKVEAGTFRNCFAATYESTKTTLRRTWCPGIGLVEMVTKSSNGGELKDELVSFRGPGFSK